MNSTPREMFIWCLRKCKLIRKKFKYIIFWLLSSVMAEIKWRERWIGMWCWDNWKHLWNLCSLRNECTRRENKTKKPSSRFCRWLEWTSVYPSVLVWSGHLGGWKEWTLAMQRQAKCRYIPLYPRRHRNANKTVLFADQETETADSYVVDSQGQGLERGW